MNERLYTLDEVSAESGIKRETLKKRAQKLLKKRGRDWLFTEAEKLMLVRNGGRMSKEAAPPEHNPDKVIQFKVLPGNPPEQKWWERGPLPALPQKGKKVSGQD